MSDLDTRLAGLHADLHAAIIPPDLALVTARSRQRTVRRRMQVGAAVAVMAVSVAVPVLRSVPDGGVPAGPTSGSDMTFELDFADAGHGYALGSDCAEPEGPCELALFATADGGRTWARRTLPEDSARGAAGLTVIRAEALVVDLVPGGSAPPRRIASTDAGRTWHAAGLDGAGEPAPLPDGAHLQRMCVGSDGSDCPYGVGTLAPDTTARVPAPSQPPLVGLVAGAAATEGGRYWAAGVDRTTRSWAISVSSDQGMTWTTTPVLVPGLPMPNDAWAVVENDGVMYATVQGSIGRGPFGLLAVHRSTDGGLTWTNTWSATADTVLRATLGSPVATAGGRLLVYSAATGTYESTDGGRTFAKAARQLPGEVTWTRGGYVAKLPDTGFAISADGDEWRPFEIR